MVPALHHRLELELHVVAEVVEPEFVVGAVRDVGTVGDLPLLIGELVLDDPDAHPEEAVQPSHPLRVAARQVIVDSDDVDAFAFERVQVCRQRRDQRLAFAGLHLGDLAGVQHHAADQLHVEVPHVQHALASFAYHRERFDEKVVYRLTGGDTRTELLGLIPELFVGERLHF